MNGTLKLTRMDTDSVDGLTPRIRFTIDWDKRGVMVFNGTIDDDGYASGKAQDKATPNAKVDFHLENQIDCA
jgi:hypothetical protein